MAYHFHDLSPYVLIGNPLTLTVIEVFAVPGALLGAALYPLGLDGPVWIYVGAGIKFILWVARFIAQAPASTVHLRAFAPYALPFLALAVMSATIWRTWTFRLSAIPLLLVGVVGATQGPRYDVIVAPSGDLAAVRDADGALEVVGKRFNAFAAEQWLTADGDGRDPAQARAFDAPCDRLGCVAALPEGESLSIVLERMAFDEDCARGSRGQRAQRARRLQGEVPVRRTGARALGRYRHDLGRQRLRAGERPHAASEPSLVACSRARARRPNRAPWPWRFARR
jgi:competence protein ComEC